MKRDPLKIQKLRDANKALAERLRTDPHADDGLLAKAEFIAEPVLLGETYATEAIRNYLEGKIQEASRHNSQARTILDQQPFEDSDPFFLWLIETTDGLTSEAQGDVGKARSHFQAAVAIGRSAKMIRLTGRSLMSLGYIANREADPVTALSYFLQLLHLPDLDDSTRAATYMYLAVLFEDQHQWEMGLLYLGEGLARTGQIAPDVEGAMRGHYAALLARSGDLVGAEESLELARQVTTPNTIHAAKLHEARGRFLFETGAYEEADRVLVLASDLIERQGAPSHIGRIVALRCEVYLEQDCPADVLNLLDRTNCDVLAVQQVRDLLLLKVEAHKRLEDFESAARCHDRFAELAEGSMLDARAFYRLHRQLVDAHSLEAQHVALISRQIELARLQDELMALMDQVANDLNSPLTSLQLVFDTLRLDPSASGVSKRIATAWTALDRMSSLAEDFSAASEEVDFELADTLV